LTVSAAARDKLLAAGWGDECVVGYVFAGYDNASVVATFDGTMNGYAVSRDRRTAVPIQNVVAPAGSIVLKGQGVVGARENPSAFNAYGYLFSNSTSRPAGADRQRVKFTFYAGTLFDAGSNLDHVPVMLYFHAESGSDGFRSNPMTE